MKALVLAAGQGSRLRPLTDDRPKVLVELLGRSLLAHQLDVFAACGIDDVAVVGGYKIEALQALRLKWFTNARYETTNMVESLLAAREFLSGDADLIISYGDIVYEADNLRQLMTSDADVALMVDMNWRAYWQQRMDDPLRDAETFKFKDDNRVAELGKKPESYDDIEAQYTGLIKISASALPRLLEFYDALDRAAEYDGQDFDNMYMTSFLQLLINAGWDVEGVRVAGGWLEVDTTEDLALYEQLAKTGELDQFCKLESS